MNPRITITLFSFVLLPYVVFCQTITFETLPGGSPVDDMIIADQYESPPYGVRFELVGEPPGTGPRLAQVGSPGTAYLGVSRTNEDCGILVATSDDMPAADEPVGCFFLTDNGSGGPGQTLRVTYVTPVRQASGVLLDIDAGCGEAWTIEAKRSNESIIHSIILDCTYPGIGNGIASEWLFNEAEDIYFIDFISTGTSSSPGFAFDNFSPSSIPADLSLVKTGPTGPNALGSLLTYDLTVLNSGPGTATDVMLTDYLPLGVSYVSAIPSQGSCGETGGVISCALGSITNGNSVTIQIQGTLANAYAVNSAAVSALEMDNNTSNNQATANTEVDCGPAVLIDNGEATTPATRLYQNAPNPFNPRTKVAFRLGRKGFAEVRVFSVSGRFVRHLFAGDLEAGPHSIDWNGTDQNGKRSASGTYFYQLELDGVVIETRKALLLR